MTIPNPDVARLIEEQLNTGRYASADEVVLAGLKLLQERELAHEREDGEQENSTQSLRSDQVTDLVALATELTKDIPDSEWKKIPTDFAQNHDHYLCGARKTS